MSERYFDELETRDPAEREADLFARLPGQIDHAVAVAPGCRGEGSQGSKQASGDRACGLTDDIGRAILKIELWNIRIVILLG